MSSRARSNSRWVRIDRRYNNPYRLTGYAWRVIFKWLALVTIWLTLGAVNGWLGLIGLVAVPGYAIYRMRLDYRLRHPVGAAATAPQIAVAWPPAPIGERNSRSIPQDVKIAVAVRDGGRCRQCGSVQDLHYDHVIPWSKGGANTVNNIQLLCGPHNRAKGADDIPV